MNTITFRNLRSVFSKKSLKQLLFFLFLLILFIEAFVMFVVIQITHKSLTQEAVRTSEALLEYYSSQLESQMDFAQQELLIFANETTLLPPVSYEDSLEQQYFQKLHMKNNMQKVLNLNTILDGIFIYRPDADTLPYFAVSSSYTSYEQELQLKEQIESRNLSENAGYWSFWHIDNKEYLLYLEKGIYGWYGIWIKAQSILQNFQLLDPNSQSGLYICDSTGAIL